jgi:1,2-phenylacetyl-CoA epoxidase catalytic subunit
MSDLKARLKVGTVLTTGLSAGETLVLLTADTSDDGRKVNADWSSSHAPDVQLRIVLSDRLVDELEDGASYELVLKKVNDTKKEKKA